MKTTITLSVEFEMYKQFKMECMRKNVKFGEQLEKFMQGFSNNHKINDFLTYEEISNPRIDTCIEEMNNLILGMEAKRALELVFKVDEWRTRLIKK